MAFLGVQKYPSRLGNSPKYSPGDIFNRIVEENQRKKEEEMLAKQNAEQEAAFNAKREGWIKDAKSAREKREAQDIMSDWRIKQVQQAGATSMKPIQRDISGWPVNPNRVTSLRPGAGINPGQSTYGFSSMQPSNRAGEVYTIDQWGNKRYL
jgi:hypothetical protein